MPSLLLKRGRVIDTSGEHDEIADVKIKDGIVVELGTDLQGEPDSVSRHLAGCVVAPDLIDLHTHIYWGGTSLGADPAILARQSGTTTLVDAGSAGAGKRLSTLPERRWARAAEARA
jgi:dihydroorotase